MIFYHFNLKASSSHIDFVISDEYIYCLTNNDEIEIFNVSNGISTERKIHYKSKISILTKDNHNNLIIVNEKNEVKKYIEDDKSWELISKSNNEIFGIVFNSKNNCYIITTNGIEDALTQKTYFSNKSLNEQITIDKHWRNLYCHHIDRHDNIWLGYDYGEWGGNLFIFDTKLMEFATPSLGEFKIELHPIKSFFEDSTATYLTSGLHHLFSMSGIILRFDNLKASILFESDSYFKNPKKKNNLSDLIDGEYIGPATYNSYDNSIYFYSQNGIYRGNSKKDLFTINNWDLIIKPKLNWESGQPHVTGSPMNVLKLEITEKNTIVFLTQNDGVGYYDGQSLKMLQ